MENLRVVDFIEREAGRVKRRGYAIGEYLIVSYTNKHQTDKYKIFRKDIGLPFINAEFADAESAVNLAEWIDNEFADYFCIWQEYPKADILALSKWSTRNGINLFELVEIMKAEKKVISSSIIAKLWHNVTSYAPKKWLRV